jgi:hypothetical protein
MATMKSQTSSNPNTRVTDPRHSQKALLAEKQKIETKLHQIDCALAPELNSHAEARRRGGRAVQMACAAIAAALFCGCQAIAYRSPDRIIQDETGKRQIVLRGESFRRSSFGSKTQLQELTVEGTTNGVRVIRMKGYSQDGSATVTSAAEAVKASAEALKGAH